MPSRQTLFHLEEKKYTFCAFLNVANGTALHGDRSRVTLSPFDNFAVSKKSCILVP